MEKTAIEEFVNNVIYRLDENTRMVSMACDNVAEKYIWQRPNESSNSIGNLILHLCGNITQYAISSLGETEDIRDRDKEFDSSSGLTKNELVAKLCKTVAKAKSTIENASSDQWLRKREVQGFHLSGIGVVLHVVEHFSYHTGQIAFWVKQLNNKPLGFYDGIDLNIKNE